MNLIEFGQQLVLPLVVSGAGTVEDNESLREGDREVLETMQEAANFMADTLSDVLSLQKIEEGQTTLMTMQVAVS